jgi:hypothetical protein
MLSHVTLRKLPKRSLLFLEDNEAAVIVAGQIYLFSHEEDLGAPSI